MATDKASSREQPARKAQTNRDRARAAVERFGRNAREVACDVVTLLEQIHTIEHEQDREAIKAIADRYDFKPFEVH